MKHIDASRKEVRKFGILFSVLFLALAGFSLYKGTGLWRWALGGSGFFLITGLFAYSVLKPIYVGWMTFAFALGWLNTRIILGLAFYLIFAPVGLLLRLFRRDILEMKFDRTAATYWVKRTSHGVDQKRYEQLF